MLAVEQAYLVWMERPRQILQSLLIVFPRQVCRRGNANKIEWIKFDSIHSQVILCHLYKVIIIFHAEQCGGSASSVAEEVRCSAVSERVQETKGLEVGGAAEDLLSHREGGVIELSGLAICEIRTRVLLI